MARGCIFAKTEVLAALSVLDREYKKAYKRPSPRNNRLLKAYSKMAVITAGGWVEDGIKSLMEMSILKLKELDGQKRLKNEADHIWGFRYYHFSKGMMFAFGAHGLEYVERKIGSTDLAILSSSFGKLKTWRDDAAHSHATTIRSNPTMVIGEMNIIFPILKKIEASTREYSRKHF